ncbi:hypothetical protein COCMIDRAFT_37469 [Bipolaris oryzae ATCC 44560]|uniref:Uncharacterized protein n=1 Tax=Bipolaris oryzae ATCC 44560 TaxID=930090 RepID=W6YZK0_COCMI|nr:uncharacterized protein COCMIDRAFT_37469 [Bipolaris oryzae ATCC 44560]EUC44752.1 hypothetical protein COCMIDRAFT_37469 [Bipolaris oryzae ATCC 44560]
MSAQALNPKHQPARQPAARNWAHTGTAIGATHSHSAQRPGATTPDLPRLRRRRACDRAVLATTLAEPLEPSPELSQRAEGRIKLARRCSGARVILPCWPRGMRPPPRSSQIVGHKLPFWLRRHRLGSPRRRSLACVPKGREDPDDGGRQCRLSACILTHPAQALWNRRDSDLTKSYILADIRRADVVGSSIISSPYSCQSMVPTASLRPGSIALRPAWRCAYGIASNE